MPKGKFRVGPAFPATNLTKSWNKATKAAKLDGRLFHDLRRSAVRNLRDEGNQQSVVMAISGYRRTLFSAVYNIMTAKQQHAAMKGREGRAKAAREKVAQ